MSFRIYRIGLLCILLVLIGCAYHQKIPSEETRTVYQGRYINDDLLLRHAPLFLVYNYSAAYNRIGLASAKHDDQGHESIYVDTEHPVIYYLKRNFTTKKGHYSNLIYRIHFPEIPLSLAPFYLGAGKNVGLMVVITVDDAQKPVLVTTVHTCGCYLSMVPTSYLPRSALPLEWKDQPIKVYGERLPSRLNYANIENPKVLVYLRPGVHRVMNLEVVDEQELKKSRHFNVIPASLKPVQELEHIPMEDGTTSFYYEKGVLKGHVKGSIKPWESILLSLPSLDFFVGTDKVYADRKDSGNPFYTSLKPWNRNASDMWNFAEFLEFWGWRL